MSENAVVAEIPSKVPSEVTEQINKEHSLISKMSKVELVAKAKELGMYFDPDTVNDKWLARKLKYTVQAATLAQHGLTESPAIQKNRAKVDNADPSQPISVGRKRMSTTGTFLLAIPEGGNKGRANTAKGKIVAYVENIGGAFTYAQFQAGVSESLGWSEETASFSENTRFKTLAQATGAWWSELKNKAKIIVEAPITQ